VSRRALRRAVPALATLVALGPGVAVAQAAAPAWRAPVAGPVRVVRPFAPPAAPWGPGHRGVDLAAAPGAPVLAAGAGRVRYAGQVAGRGVVVVGHAGGLATEYEPVAPLVARGERVSPGSVLGLLAPGGGHCGRVSCLHWGLRRDGQYLDPMGLLRRPRAPVLLPFLDVPVGAERRPGIDPSSRLVAAGAAAGGTGLVAAAVPAVARRLRPTPRAGRSPLWRASGTPDSR
jgi:murein DD-endopeptidase MepM/ murein hydrolase activator NlpD